MKVWGRTPSEARATPNGKKHWIEVGTGFEHNPAPSTDRGRRRAKARAVASKKTAA